MKYKKLIIVSIILIVVGFLTAVITLATKQFNIKNLDNSLVSKTYDINDEFNSIDCNLMTADLNIYLTTDEKNYALCLEKEDTKFDVEVVNNVLTVMEIQSLQLISSSRAEVSLYINKDTLENLKVVTSTGDISILDAFNINNIIIKGDTNDVDFIGITSEEITVNISTGDAWIDRVITNNLNVITTTGDIDVSNCKINNNLNLKVTTGEVELSDNEIIGDLKMEADTGDLNLEYITCNNIDLEVATGDMTLNDVIALGNLTINSDTGFVELNHSDALNIYIKTSTGRVEGSILTDKVFDAKSDTGKVSVPSSSKGGICKIRTSTGRIKIVIE